MARSSTPAEEAADPKALLAALTPFSPFPFTPDDAMLLDEAASYQIIDAESYAEGFAVLKALAGLTKEVAAHHEAWRGPLNEFRTPALAQLKADTDRIAPAAATLARALPEWKRLSDAADAREAARVQAEADEAARALQEAQVASLRNVAAVEPNPAAKASLEAQAAAVAAVPAVARPIEAKPTAVTPRGGVIPKRMVPEIHDIRALLRAWLDGKCHLDIEAALIEAVLPKLRDAASTMGTNISAVYPGVTARADEKAHVR